MENNLHKMPLDLEIQRLQGELSDGEWTFADTGYRGFIFQSGSGTVTLDGEEVGFTAPCLIWLQERRDIRLRAKAGSRGVNFSLTELGLAQAIGIGPNAQALRLAISRDFLLVKLELPQARKLAANLEAILEEISNPWPGIDDVIKHRLAIFLLEAWRLSGPVIGDWQPLPRTIMQRFMHALELHLRDQWTITQYADVVGVTAERLNATIRRVTGRSPLAIIHARLTDEAIALLEGSSLRIADIAETLGFHDPAYFSRFFKRQTGYSPNECRLNSSLRIRDAKPFSAWP